MRLRSSALLDLCEECFLVNLPKRVAIRNLRLGLALFVLRIGAVAWVVVLMVRERPWLRVELPTGSYAFWTIRPDRSWLQAMSPDEAVVCDKDTIPRYSYQYGDDPSYRYANITCVSIIPAERSVRGESELFIPTFFEETRAETRAVPPPEDGCEAACAGLNETCKIPDHFGHLMPGGTWRFEGLNELQNCLCICQSVRHNFVLGVSEMRIALEHNALIRWSPSHEETYSSQIESDRMTTIVRNPTTKEELFSSPPGENFRMSVAQVLELAQTSLEHELTSTRLNGLEGDVNPFPVARMTGMVLNVRLLYHNQDDEGHTKSHDGPICYVEFEPELVWNSKPRADFGEPVDVITGEGDGRFRHYYGITIKFTAAGSFSIFDPWTFALYLVACAVYIQIPGTVMDFIVSYLLGLLSQIYRNITLPVMTTSAMLSGMLVRSLAFRQNFDTLLAVRDRAEREKETNGRDAVCEWKQGNEDEKEPDATLSSVDLDELLQDLLSHKEVGEVFKDLSAADMSGIRNHLIGSQFSAFTAGDFVRKTTNNEGCGEALTMKLFAKSFESGRKRSPLENLFTTTSARTKCLEHSITNGTNGSGLQKPPDRPAPPREFCPVLPDQGHRDLDDRPPGHSPPRDFLT